MTDYKQLCRGLVDDLELCDWPYKLKEVIRADIDRARTALAESETELADGKVAELVSWLLDKAIQAADASQPKAAGMLTWAAQLIGEHVELLDAMPVPVPVSERLPEPGDCDAEGRCWWGAHHLLGGIVPVSWRFVSTEDRLGSEVYWLPAHALPMPRHH